MSQAFHLSDQELLQAIDGELTPKAARKAQEHLSSCWSCRARQGEIETTIGDFVRFYRDEVDRRIPSSEGPRALLKARMALLSASQAESKFSWFRSVSQHLGWAALALALITATVYVSSRTLPRRSMTLATVTVPDPTLTPGATVLLNQPQICGLKSENNRMAPVALQRRVFEEYGIGSPEPGAYEVDYLITPALGGADDIHNLWPESSRATVWNSRVKDALEDRLRDMVCDGQLDLATAQREIAGNWIEAYKKYFHTNRPLTGAR